MDDVVITAGARTPFGKFGGGLAAMSAIDLGAAVIREVVERSRAPKERVGHVIMGTVVQDGLWSPMDHCHMGVYGSSGAREYEISRGQQDEWALRSQQRYAAALAAGKFAEEIMPIEVSQPRGGIRRVDADEQPRPDTTLEKLAALKPAFE